MTNDPQVHCSLSLKSSLPNISNELHKRPCLHTLAISFQFVPFLITGAWVSSQGKAFPRL